MCGILVVLSKNEPLDLSLCRRALSSMNWRGPDFTYSRTWENRLFLGQTVLSITGHPEGAVGRYHYSNSKQYEIYFNGEIYNHEALKKRFMNSACEFGTDTETLVNLHDQLPMAEVPRHLDGMYAYVIFDGKSGQLHLTRDPQGEKSLYVYEDNDRIVIASSIPAIRLIAPQISVDVHALRDYFFTRHLMLFGGTVFHGIREVLPGDLETLDLKSLKWSKASNQSLKDWIDPQKYQDNCTRERSSLAEELDSLLNQCVQEMLPKDRVYSSIVSGGVDSSLISHYVVKNGNPNILVAVNHVGKDRISNDLTPFEKVLHKNIDILKVDLPTYASEIERCQRACGSPLPAHSFVPQSIQCAHVRSSNSKVLFGGDGADEFFGGYPAYLGKYPAQSPFSPSPYTKFEDSGALFLENDASPIKKHLSIAWKSALEAYSFISNDEDRVALAMMYCDAAYQLPCVGLRGSDLMAMMWSIEMRSVFLRKPVISFALNLPIGAKINRSPNGEPLLQSKTLLKKLFCHHYNQDLLTEKQGFAGFPNESGIYLGNPEDYQAIQTLKINPASVPDIVKNRATAWKLINVEYFLRNIL